MKTLDSSTMPLKKRLYKWTTTTGLLIVTGSLFAAGGSSSLTLGNMASSITGSFSALARLITGGCYLAGLAFAVTAIMKFKQHKDNPTQIPIGTPVALVFIAAALLFLPSILHVAGFTMFGGEATVYGPTGSIFTQ